MNSICTSNFTSFCSFSVPFFSLFVRIVSIHINSPLLNFNILHRNLFRIVSDISYVYIYLLYFGILWPLCMSACLIRSQMQIIGIVRRRRWHQPQLFMFIFYLHWNHLDDTSWFVPSGVRKSRLFMWWTTYLFLFRCEWVFDFFWPTHSHTHIDFYRYCVPACVWVNSISNLFNRSNRKQIYLFKSLFITHTHFCVGCVVDADAGWSAAWPHFYFVFQSNLESYTLNYSTNFIWYTSPLTLCMKTQYLYLYTLLLSCTTNKSEALSLTYRYYCVQLQCVHQCFFFLLLMCHSIGYWFN